MPKLEYDDGILCWPYWLPIPERQAFGYELLEDAVSRTDMDVGSIARIKYKVDQVKFSCQVIMRDCEIEWLEAFEAERLNQGQTWFLMPMWVAGHIQHYLVQFTERPKVTQVNGNDNWVQLRLRTKHRRILPIDGLRYGERNTLPAWPSNMPILQDGYSYEVRSTDMKGATNLPTVKRPEFNIDEVSITAKLSLSMSQIAVFEWFEREILNMGARWFSMPVWIGGDLKTYQVRFKGRPKFALNGFRTLVSFQLELEQRDLMHPQVVEWLLYMSPEELFFFLQEFHGMLHVTMPGLTIIPDGVYIKV